MKNLGEGKNMVFTEASNIKNKIFAPELSLNIKLLVKLFVVLVGFSVVAVLRFFREKNLRWFFYVKIFAQILNLLGG
jgi:hypothetical protein